MFNIDLYHDFTEERDRVSITANWPKVPFFLVSFAITALFVALAINAL